MAVEETGMGVIEDKVIKNHFASEYIYKCDNRDSAERYIVKLNLQPPLGMPSSSYFAFAFARDRACCCPCFYTYPAYRACVLVAAVCGLALLCVRAAVRCVQRVVVYLLACSSGRQQPVGRRAFMRCARGRNLTRFSADLIYNSTLP